MLVAILIATVSLRCIVGSDRTYESELKGAIKQCSDSGDGFVWIVGRPTAIPDSNLDISAIHRGVHMLERWTEILRRREDPSIRTTEGE